MTNNILDFQKNVHSSSIEAINGIKFTCREIDILACISGRRTAKRVASFLHISPKTVENHIRNIMQKLGCNSRERIIDFIEGAPEAPLLRQRYIQLLCAAVFEQALKEASLQVKKEDPLNSCTIINASGETYYFSFISTLKKILEVLKIYPKIEDEDQFKDLSTLRKNLESHPEGGLLYLLPQSLLKEVQGNRELSPVPLKNFIDSSDLSLLISNKHSKENFITSFPVKNPQTSEESLHYYSSLLEIIKCFCPALKEDEILSKLKNQCAGTHDIARLNHRGQATEETPQKADLQPVFKNLVSSSLLWKWKFPLAGFSFMLVCLSIGFIFLKDGEYTSSSQNRRYIHSELTLPAKYTLLDRPKLIAEIDSKLKGQEGIQRIALIGLAGTGKKVLARQYAKQKNRGMIWEINSERKETIVSSFERLAHAVSQSNEDKENLKAIQDIKTPEERENRLIYFVQDRLKNSPDWLLIFYNVDNFSTLGKHLPHDSAWGTGQVIITTTDSNIKNNNYIQESVHVGGLSQQQRMDLFSKILKKGTAPEWTATQLKNAKEFLNQIPPFPLDVALAAYYIKDTKIPYNLYLQYLNENNNEFNKLQENVIKEFGEHEKTRYNIIALSLKNLIDLHPEYKNLLFFLSLMSSKYIPNELLYAFKDRSIVDNFLHDLNKYSLTIVTLYDMDKTIPTFSIHKSVQENIFNYLRQNATALENKNLIPLMFTAIEKHTNEIIGKEDAARMHVMLDHCLSFTHHDQGVNASVMKGRIGIIIGTLYYYGGNFSKAKHLFEENLAVLFTAPDRNYSMLGMGLARLGSLSRKLGQYEQAKAVLEKGLLLYKQHLPQDYVGRAFVLRHLAGVYRNLGHYEKAKSLIEESLSLYEKSIPRNFIQASHSQVCLGKIHKDLGNYAEAKNLLRISYSATVKYYGEEHPRTARVLRDLGQVYYLEGDFVKGRQLTQQALEIFQKRKHPERYTVLENLAELHLKIAEQKTKNFLTSEKQALKEQVINYLSQALKIVQTHFPPDSFHITRIQGKIAKLKENQA